MGAPVLFVVMALANGGHDVPVVIASEKAAPDRAEWSAPADAVGQVVGQPAQERPAQTLNAVDESLAARYAAAIQARVQANWMRPDHVGDNLDCQVQIKQAPGGQVLSVEVIAEKCHVDESVRRSVRAAVLRAQPLPYEGFESVFNEQILFTFRIADG